MIYIVPNYGPLVRMTKAREAWATRIGATVTNSEFGDLESARKFADSVGSKVIDENKKVVYDSSQPKESGDES